MSRWRTFSLSAAGPLSAKADVDDGEQIRGGLGKPTGQGEGERSSSKKLSPQSSVLSTEKDRPRTAQSFCVSKADIAANGYDLSLNRYKEVVHEEIQHASPNEILKNLAKLESEIQTGMKELEEMLR